MIAKTIWLAVVTLHLSESDGKLWPFSLIEDELQAAPSWYGGYQEPTPCGFQDLESKYSKKCRKNTYLEDIFNKIWSDDGTVTGQRLLKRISSICSNYESFRKCANCTAKHDCPEERSTLFEALIGKWSIFCDGDQASEWLQTILQNGYNFNKSCSNMFSDVHFDCIGQSIGPYDVLRNSTALALMSLSEGLNAYRTFISEYCKCAVGNVLDYSEYWKQCGSSWQDILLTAWLEQSTLPGLRYHINENEIKMLQVMRCSSKG